MSAHIPSHPINRDPEPQIIYNCQRAIHHFMEIPSQDDTPVTLPASTAISPTASTTASTNLNIDTSSYLSVPGSRFLQSTRSLAGPLSFEEELDRFFSPVSSNSLPQIVEPAKQRSRSLSIVGDPGTRQPPMSVCSTSSIDSNTSSFSNPFAGRYRLPAFCNMSSSRSTITATEKDQMIQALNTHRINTLGELRRIEKTFAKLGSSDVAAPMTAAWSYYVNSHGLLTEIRGLTKNYPFSAECLEEAKRRVYSDPESNKSWNLCWLILNKIHQDQLIPYYAQYQASQPTMWGGQTPSSAGVAQLTNAFVAEWHWAVQQLLGYWDQPPSR